MSCCRSVLSFALLLLIVLVTDSAGAGAIDNEQLIGTTNCPAAGQNAQDWDTVAECPSTGGTWSRGPYFLGATTDSCDSNHAGMMQWTGSALEYCNGTVWQNAQSSSGSTGYFILTASTYNGCLAETLSSLTNSGTTATLTTAAAHDLSPGMSVTITDATPSAYNGTFTITSVPSPTTFTYALGTNPGGSASAISPQTVSSLTYSGTTATVTTAAAHGLSVGALVTISGATVSSGTNYYNGATLITSIPSSTTFTYVMNGTPSQNAAGSPAYTVTLFYCTVGGEVAADQVCFNDLTTNTGWMGHSTAASNGQLVTPKVHAWVSGAHKGNRTLPNTTYTFGYAGNSAKGGATFTTDAMGYSFFAAGTAAWSGSTYFGVTANYWTGGGGSAGVPFIGATSTACNGWSSPIVNYSGAYGTYGDYGTSSSTTYTRWGVTGGNCANFLGLICFVNP